MLFVVLAYVLTRWRLSLDARREAVMARPDVPVRDAQGREVKNPTGGIARQPDEVKQAFLDEESALARWARRTSVGFLAAVALWCGVFAAHAGASASVDAAVAMIERCDSHPSDVQACASPAVDEYLSASGSASTLDALVWIVAVL